MFSHSSQILTARSTTHDMTAKVFADEAEQEISVRTPHWKANNN